MGKRTLEDCIEQLKKSDKNSLERRAERLQELPVIQVDGRLFSSQKEWDYSGEASESFIVGNYRSTIFCCACAVDQIIRYEYLKMPGHTYDELGRTFGQHIRVCKNKGGLRLSEYIGQAELLNKIRNVVAVHPLFIDPPIESDPKGLLRKELLLEDIKRLLNLVKEIKPEMESEIKSTTVVSEVEGKRYIFGRIVSGQDDMPFNLDGFWGLIERDILKFLAFLAWCIMKNIVEGLYGVTP